LSAMGLLAASVAHEVNNPMTFAVANLGLARGEVEELLDVVKNEQVRQRIVLLRDMIADSLDGVERVVQLVRELRTFVRADAARRDRISPDDAVRDAARIARTHAEGRAAIQLELGNVPPVLADRTRLGQVFLNLIVNAAQAMPVGNAQHYRIVARTTTLAQDALILIQDNGPGISEEHVNKIFDPFFTTKLPGEGTGLGLAISREIVESLGGDIHVESKMGDGAKFTVRLPLARD
jgi:signal transduction histidine kinase